MASWPENEGTLPLCVLKSELLFSLFWWPCIHDNARAVHEIICENIVSSATHLWGSTPNVFRWQNVFLLWYILLGCQNAGLWMMKWWRSAPTSVWVNNFLFNREHKRDDIQCIWMVAESSPNLSPNPPMGSESESSLMHTLLIGLSQTIRGSPASWNNASGRRYRFTTQKRVLLKTFWGH